MISLGQIDESHAGEAFDAIRESLNELALHFGEEQKLRRD